MDSEKLIEKTLVDGIKELDGWALKLPCTYVAGLPDRMVLLPGGRIFFAEIKTTGKKPTAVQKLIHERLRRLGFTVYVIDTLDQLNEILNKLLD